MNRNKIVMQFAPVSECDVPIIKFHIGDTEHYGIVDTGAETTIFNTSVVDLMESRKKKEISIVGVSGETKPAVIVTGDTKIWMKNESNHLLILKVHGYINDISHLSSHFLENIDDSIKIDAIFGSDMLNEFNAKVDFINKEISFKL